MTFYTIRLNPKLCRETILVENRFYEQKLLTIIVYALQGRHNLFPKGELNDPRQSTTQHLSFLHWNTRMHLLTHRFLY